MNPEPRPHGGRQRPATAIAQSAAARLAARLLGLAARVARLDDARARRDHEASSLQTAVRIAIAKSRSPVFAT